MLARLGLVVAVLWFAFATQQKVPARLDYVENLQEVARDIATLKQQFTQLKEFSPPKHLDPDRLVINYAYRTHKALFSGGWTSAVPNPNEDGVWFYVDFHDPNSRQQIHTQPVTGTIL